MHVDGIFVVVSLCFHGTPAGMVGAIKTHGNRLVLQKEVGDYSDAIYQVHIWLRYVASHIFLLLIYSIASPFCS